MPRPLRYDPDNDFYTVLGVAPTATLDEIHRAYRQRAKLVHPDLNRERLAWAHDQFQRLNSAHDILGDPTLRGDYDQKRRLYEDTHRVGYKSAALADASRAAWARRNRRRPPALYYLSVGILTFGVLPILYFMVAGFISDLTTNSPDSLAATSRAPIRIVVATSAPTLDPALQAFLPTWTPTPEPPTCNFPGVQITEPHNGETVTPPFVIRGTAYAESLSYYSVSIIPSDGVVPQRGEFFSTIYGRRTPVKDGILVPLAETSPLSGDSGGDMLLRLEVATTVDNKFINILPHCTIELHLYVPRVTTDMPTDPPS